MLLILLDLDSNVVHDEGRNLGQVIHRHPVDLFFCEILYNILTTVTMLKLSKRSLFFIFTFAAIFAVGFLTGFLQLLSRFN